LGSIVFWVRSCACWGFLGFGIEGAGLGARSAALWVEHALVLTLTLTPDPDPDS
jgi:hypothetical protein